MVLVYVMSLAGVAALVTGVVLVLRAERRKRHAVLSLESELTALVSDASAVEQHHQDAGSAVKGTLKFVNETLKLADVAMAQLNYRQGALYLGLARLSLAWANFIGANPDADDFRDSMTNRLVFGLTLLRKNKLDGAHEELGRVWLEDSACAMAKMVALQGHIWVLERQGNFEDAQDEQELLTEMMREMNSGSVEQDQD